MPFAELLDDRRLDHGLHGLVGRAGWVRQRREQLHAEVDEQRDRHRDAAPQRKANQSAQRAWGSQRSIQRTASSTITRGTNTSSVPVATTDRPSATAR